MAEMAIYEIGIFFKKVLTKISNMVYLKNTEGY